jgi:hypothetical protein
MLGSNALGAAHEFSNYDNYKEMTSDLKNNYIGSKIGANAQTNLDIPMKSYNALKNSELDVLERPYASRQISPDTYINGEFTNGGKITHCEDGGTQVGSPEYIHPSNVFAPHVIPVPKVHFSDDTSNFDMGLNLNDLVQKNGGTVRDIYERVTGKNWATAKKEGHTSGSYKDNLALRNRLLEMESVKNTNAYMSSPTYREYIPTNKPSMEEYIPRVSTSVRNENPYFNDYVETPNDYPYGGYISRPPRTFNSSNNRMGAEQLMSATSNDFMHTKVNHDRQKYADSKVDWGFMDWAKEPVGATLGMLGTTPIVGDIVNDAVGDSFLTRTSGYQLGKGAGKISQGVGQAVGGVMTGNPMMIASGVGDVGSGIGGTIGSLNAESAMGGYDKSGYIEGKRTEKGANDFGNMMDSFGGLYGNALGGVESMKNFGGVGGMFDSLKGGKKGTEGFGNAMFNLYGQGISFNRKNGGWLEKY